MNDKKDISADMPWIERYMKEEKVNYYEFNEFSNIEEVGNGIIGKMYKANWKQSEKCVILKSFNLDNAIVKEIVYEVCKLCN